MFSGSVREQCVWGLCFSQTPAPGPHLQTPEVTPVAAKWRHAAHPESQVSGALGTGKPGSTDSAVFPLKPDLKGSGREHQMATQDKV